MVALRILVPPVRVRVLPGQRRKIVNWLVSRLAIFIFQNLAKRGGGTNLRGRNDMSDFGINLCFWQPYHTFSVIPAPLFLPFHRMLSLGAHAAIPAAERESSGARGSFYEFPVERGTTMPHFNQEGRREQKGYKQRHTNREKRETALIGPGGRQPRAERGRGLCERSEFRSPRARRRRPSEKARYRAAGLLGSFFSPKRRMNKKPLGFPVKWGMTFGKEMAGHKRAYKMHRQGSPQFFLHKKRGQPGNREGVRCRKRTEGNQAKAQSNPSRRSIVGVSRAVKIPLRVRPRLA